MDFGLTPIRINPDSKGEVVWARRIDPARAILTSIPLPESNHRHGDLVLHDGAPTGYRVLDGEELAVFNELDLLAPGKAGTYEVTVEVANIDDLVAFETTFERLGCATEDWSTIRMLCVACSEGRPHAHPEPQVEGIHRFAVAASSRKTVEQGVAAWAGKHRTRKPGEIVVRVKPRSR